MPLPSSRAILASFSWVSWKLDSGRSNTSRAWEYAIAVSRLSRAAPRAPNTIPNRASLRHDSGADSPPACGNWAEAGSRTLSKTSSDVTDARRDSFLWIVLAVKPGVSVGTRNPRIPSSVCAHTVATSARLPLVIHILVPLSTQSVPSRRARVRIPAGLEPKSGSVNPKQPMASPAASLGSHSLFCSSEPYR